MIWAATDWAEASIAIAGIAFVTVVVSILIWQISSTGRTGLSAKRENAYRKLAEDSAAAQHRTADQLERAIAELGELRARTGEIERLIKAVE